MNIPSKLVFCSTLAAAVFVSPCLRGATAGDATANSISSASTNSNPEATMTALFGDPVIAKGKGFEIKRSQLDELLTGAKANAAAAGQMLPPDFEVQILNQLIFVQMMLQQATDADRIEGKKQADLQFASIVKRFASQDALAQQLKAVGMTIDDLRAKATQEATARAALQRVLKVDVSDAEAMTYYSNHPATFEQPEKARLQDILLLTVDPATRSPLPADQIQAKRKLINELVKRVLAGESFTNLAAQYSEDPNSKENNGVLPPLGRDQMTPELSAAAFSLTNNQVSDVIELPYGFYLLKVVDKVPAHKLAYTDKVDDATVAESIKTYLSQQQTSQRAPAYIANLKIQDDVEILDPNLKALATALQNASSNSAPAAAVPEQ